MESTHALRAGPKSVPTERDNQRGLAMQQFASSLLWVNAVAQLSKTGWLASNRRAGQVSSAIEIRSVRRPVRPDGQNNYSSLRFSRPSSLGPCFTERSRSACCLTVAVAVAVTDQSWPARTRHRFSLAGTPALPPPGVTGAGFAPSSRRCTGTPPLKTAQTAGQENEALRGDSQALAGRRGPRALPLYGTARRDTAHTDPCWAMYSNPACLGQS